MDGRFFSEKNSEGKFMNAILSGIKNKLVKNLSNIPGWRTNDKLVVFFVDDWGSIRIKDQLARQILNKKGVNCETNRFDRFDSIASSEDLSLLFELLSSFRDRNGKKPSFTAIAVMANPDFKKIKEAGFKEYFYEPLNLTLERYENKENLLKLWAAGREEGIFFPQYHGREHINVGLWMQGLAVGDNNLIAAFENESLGIPSTIPSGYLNSYLGAFDLISKSHLDGLIGICNDGINLFRHIFGETPYLFTSPSLIHPYALEKAVSSEVKFIDRAKMTYEPVGDAKYKRRLHYLAEKNESDQVYITRNCSFEPNMYNNQDSVDITLSDIENSFRWGKPALISSHRVNFVSGHSLKNRENGLKNLQILLRKILAKWPEVEFLTFREFSERVLHSR